MIVATFGHGQEIDARSLELHVARRVMVVAVAGGRVAGRAAAAAMFSDWVVFRRGAVIDLSSPLSWSGVVWRRGRAALRLVLEGAPLLDADAALQRRLCDDIIPDDETATDYVARWIGGRSVEALRAGARLIRGRGGDVLERWEFARLFAAGDPKEGLSAFLERRQPRFTQPAASGNGRVAGGARETSKPRIGEP